MMDKEERLPIPKEKRTMPFLLLVYSAVFVILCALVFLVFIKNERVLIRFYETNKDAFSQRYIFIFAFQRFLEKLFSGGTLNTWDWSIGLGADGLAFNLSNLVNPISWITLFHPEKYADITYTIGIVLKLYLSGFTFVLFSRKLGSSDLQVLAGAVMYALSPWNMGAALTQGSFLMASVLLPLVLLGEEKILRKGSPLLFILSVAYTVLVAFMFSYMIAIIVIVYYFVRYYTCDYTEKTSSGFLRMTGVMLVSGLTGVMTSGAGLVLTLMKYGNSTASTGADVPALFELSRYMRFPLNLMDLNTFFGSNSCLSVTSLGIVMIPVIILMAFKKRTNAVMTVILMVFALIPFMGSLMNFFSYVSGRWMFALALFYSLATADCLDEKYLGDKRIRISIAVTFTFYSAYLMVESRTLSLNDKRALLASWITALILVIVIEAFHMGKRHGEGSLETEDKDKERKRWLPTGKAALPAVLAVIMCIGLFFTYNLNSIAEDDYFFKAGEASDKINKSSQRIMEKVDDDDFYRIDQLGSLRGFWTPHCKVNEAMYFGNRAVNVFYSSVDANWLEYNKLLGNNMGYFKRVAPNSNDNRFGMDLLTSVKYYIGNDKELIDTASDYAGHSFTKYIEYDGIELMKNKYSMGFGSVFYKYMKMDEWLKLSYPERELAMLEAVVLDKGAKAPEGLAELKASDIDGIVETLDYDSSQKGNRVTLKSHTDGKHQLFLSLQNVENHGGGSLMVVARAGKLKKYAVDTGNDNRGFSDIEDLTMNIGYSKEAGDEIRLKFKHMPADDMVRAKNDAEKRMNEPGVSYDEIVLYSVPLAAYDERAEKIVDNRMVTDVFENDRIKGHVDCEKAGALYLSIPYDKGWQIKVDGKAVETPDKTDIAFIRVDLEAGRHTIELDYHTRGFWSGAALTVIGLVIAVFLCFSMRRDS